MLAPGAVLQERYRIEGPAGRGGMGAVYAATDLRLVVPVAIKCRLGSAALLGDAFEREARLLAGLRHPALPKVTDHFVEGAAQCLVMEFVAGEDLATRLLRRGAPFAPDVVLGWADQLLDALAYLHAQTPPVLHRDIKPANLKVTAQDRIALLDFGLAKGPAGGGVSLAGYTLTYAPPEQIRGEGTTPQSDLYALAATLHDLLTGQAPPDALARLAAVGTGAADPLRPAHEIDPAVPPAVGQVLARALALAPVARPADAEGMRRLLRDTGGEPATVLASAVAVPPAPPPGPAADPAPPGNLPAPPTPLVGRGAELQDVRELLLPGRSRLVTLTGPGGIGKTRLALEAAAGASRDYPGGAWFVDLAPIADPDLVLPAIAGAVGVRDTGEQPLREALVARLTERPLLLVLDNFEQVTGAAPLLADLLAACPGLAVLATSREALRLRSERELPVPPLDLPNLDHLPPPPKLARSEAVALFVERTLAVRPGFALTADNARAVAELCVRLDGLPLAIELAAARGKLLIPQAILARLGSRLGLLTGGARDAPARHRALRNTIGWSHDLLAPAERAVFRRLAVFAGGFTLEAAEAVQGAGGQGPGAGHDDELVPGPRPPTPDPLDLVAALVDGSLLQAVEVAGEPGLRMLETIREYALEELVASGEEEAARAVHAAYYLALAERAEPALRGAEQGAWFARLEAEHPNLRAALAWALEQADGDGAVRLGAALWWFWYAHGHLGEGRSWLEAALARPATDAAGANLARVKALNGAGVLAYLQGDHGRAVERYEASLALARALGDRPGVGRALHQLAMAAHYGGEPTRAETLFEEALALSRDLGDRRSMAAQLNSLGALAKDQGDYPRAAALFAEALATYRELGDVRYVAGMLMNLGDLACVQGDYARAIQLGRESLELFEELGDRPSAAYALINLAMAADHHGESARAQALYDEALAVARELGDTWAVATALDGLGRVALRRGESARAEALGEEALALHRQLDYKQGVAASLVALGRARLARGDERSVLDLVRQGLVLADEMNDRLGVAVALEALAAAIAGSRPGPAARLLGAAEALRAAIGSPVSPADRPGRDATLAAVRRALGDAATAEAEAEGRGLTPATAVALARELG